LKQEQNVHVKANKKHRNVTNGWMVWIKMDEILFFVSFMSKI